VHAKLEEGLPAPACPQTLSSSADRRPHTLTGPRQRTRERVHLLPPPFPSVLAMWISCRMQGQLLPPPPVVPVFWEGSAK
jgi:hypothetical protein